MSSTILSCPSIEDRRDIAKSYHQIERYHIIAIINLTGRIYDYHTELVPPRINPLLSQAVELLESSGILFRDGEPKLSVTRWI